MPVTLTSTTTAKVKKMTDIKDVLIENEALHAENEFLRKQNRALKLRCSKYCLENKKLETKVADIEFSRNFLGVAMTDEDIAIEAAENCYVPYSGDDF